MTATKDRVKMPVENNRSYIHVGSGHTTLNILHAQSLGASGKTGTHQRATHLSGLNHITTRKKENISYTHTVSLNKSTQVRAAMLGRQHQQDSTGPTY